MNKPPVKVTIKDSPSQQVLAKANEEVSTTDARGRVIKLKKPGVLAQYTMSFSGKNHSPETVVAP